MKKTMWSSVASLLAAGVLMGGCMADFGGESDSEGGAAQGPHVGGGEAVGEAQQALTCGVLSGGQTLSAGQSNTSCDGRFKLLTQGTDGNVVLLGPTGPVWATNAAGAGNRLVMQTDGNLVVYSPSNAPVWNSGTAGHSGARLAIQNNGKLEIYTPSTYVLWQSACGAATCGPVSGIRRPAPASFGNKHTMAIKSDGTVWAWGYNAHGQLGEPKDADVGPVRPSPVKVLNLLGFAAVVARGDFTLALKSDGTVWGWGNDNSVYLGDRAPAESPGKPVQLPTLKGVVAVAAGDQHGLAVKGDGKVWAWGYNGSGQLGDGTTVSRRTPVQVSSLKGVVAVAASRTHNLALESDGTVWAWGSNSGGQLGDGTLVSRSTPVRVSNLKDVVAVATGDSFSLALTRDGTVWRWGWWGSSLVRTPQQMSTLTGIVAVAAGYQHSLAVTSDGKVLAWGDNNSGQLGNGTFVSSSTPVQVSTLTGVVAVTAGNNNSLAVTSDGKAWSWGGNRWVQLGDGTSVSRTTPVQVIGLPMKL